jgi:hypothetical protein
VGYFFNLAKNCPKQTVTQLAKIRPIWSPWQQRCPFFLPPKMIECDKNGTHPGFLQTLSDNVHTFFAAETHFSPFSYFSAHCAKT